MGQVVLIINIKKKIHDKYLLLIPKMLHDKCRPMIHENYITYILFKTTRQFLID
jgi:hypothetical protein